MSKLITHKKFIDPLKFTEADMPVIILCDGLKDPIAAFTKVHTAGNYSHTVIMVEPGKIVSQDFVLRKRNVEAYRTSDYVLKFIKIKRLSKKVKKEIFKAVEDDLNKPWYKRLYDIVGFIGQAIKIPKLNTPWLNYCSENTAKYMRLDSRVKKVLKKQVSPSDINRVVNANPQLFKCLGYWFED